jgi:hypothetical protein
MAEDLPGDSGNFFPLWEFLPRYRPSRVSVAALILAIVGTEIPKSLRTLAKYQAGVISRRQALKSGMSVKSVDWLLQSGTWRPVHWGVYATSQGTPGRHAALWAALLYAGPGARLSHETAAEMLKLTGEQTAPIHLKIPGDRRVARTEGLVIHRSSRPASTWPFQAGTLPHTMAEETVVDLVHAAADLDTAARWVTSAFARDLVSEEWLVEELASRKRLRWRGSQLDDLIAAAAGGSHSTLEYRYHRDVVRAHGLPEAARQVPFTKPDGRTGYRDSYYAEFKLIVELDGKRYHSGERRFGDEDRDNQAASTGVATLRFGWEDVTAKACETAAIVASSLRARGWAGTLRPCSPGCRAQLSAPGGTDKAGSQVTRGIRFS